MSWSIKRIGSIRWGIAAVIVCVAATAGLRSLPARAQVVPLPELNDVQASNIEAAIRILEQDIAEAKTRIKDTSVRKSIRKRLAFSLPFAERILANLKKKMAIGPDGMRLKLNSGKPKPREIHPIDGLNRRGFPLRGQVAKLTFHDGKGLFVMEGTAMGFFCPPGARIISGDSQAVLWFGEPTTKLTMKKPYRLTPELKARQRNQIIERGLELELPTDKARGKWRRGVVRLQSMECPTGRLLFDSGLLQPADAALNPETVEGWCGLSTILDVLAHEKFHEFAVRDALTYLENEYGPYITMKADRDRALAEKQKADDKGLTHAAKTSQQTADRIQAAMTRLELSRAWSRATHAVHRLIYRQHIDFVKFREALLRARGETGRRADCLHDRIGRLTELGKKKFALLVPGVPYSPDADGEYVVRRELPESEGDRPDVMLTLTMRYPSRCRCGGKCPLTVTATNESNVPFDKTLLLLGGIDGGQWRPLSMSRGGAACAGGGSGIVCSTAPAALDPGASRTFDLATSTRSGRCRPRANVCWQVISGDAAGPDLSEKDQPHLFQYALRQAGYDPGPVDGKVGPATRRAIAAARDAAGLPEGDGADTLLYNWLLPDLPAQAEGLRACATIAMSRPSPPVSPYDDDEGYDGAGDEGSELLSRMLEGLAIGLAYERHRRHNGHRWDRDRERRD